MTKSVLIVEDDAAVLSVLNRILDGDGYKVVGAASLAEAKQIIERSAPFDIALVDFWLEGKNSVPLLDLLRERNPDAPVTKTVPSRIC